MYNATQAFNPSLSSSSSLPPLPAARLAQQALCSHPLPNLAVCCYPLIALPLAPSLVHTLVTCHPRQISFPYICVSQSSCYFQHMLPFPESFCRVFFSYPNLSSSPEVMFQLLLPLPNTLWMQSNLFIHSISFFTTHVSSMKYPLPLSTDFYLPSHLSIYSLLLYLLSKWVKLSKSGTLLSMLGCAQWGITWIIMALLAICNVNFTEALLWVIESTVQDWSKKHCVRGHPRCFQGCCSCCISYVHAHAAGYVSTRTGS